MGESSLKQKRRGMFAERVSGRDWSGCCPAIERKRRWIRPKNRLFIEN